MRSPLLELRRAYGDLDSFLASISPVTSELRCSANPLVQRSLPLRRQFDYSVFSVVLYAIFEQFVESIAWSFASSLASGRTYGDLPQSLTQSHLKGSAHLLARKGGREASVEEVIKNLHSCYTASSASKLTREAVLRHEANFRLEPLSKLLAGVGIRDFLGSLQWSEPLIAWYKTFQGLDERPAKGVPTGVVENRLEDIVQARNDVAHGNTPPVQLAGATEMGESLEFMRALSESIFVIVAGQYFLDCLSGLQGFDATDVLRGDPFRDGYVVLLEPPDGTNIITGTIAIAYKGDMPVHAGAVAGVRVTQGAPEVGLELTFALRKNQRLLLIPSSGWDSCV